MPITLEQAKATMQTKLEQTAVDEFRRQSFLLDQLTFDNAVSPGTGGSRLTYGYTRLKSPSTAQFRNINEEYTPDEALREPVTIDLKIFGGAFEIDRVIQDTSGQLNEAQFQMQQKIIGASNLFHDTVINGDSAKDGKSFDGLDVALTGTDTEINTDGLVDLTDPSIDKFALLDSIDQLLAELDGRPSVLMGNSRLIMRIKAAARRAGYLSQTEDAFGRKVDSYDTIPLIDLGHYYDGQTKKTRPIVDIVKRGEEEGLTDLYAVQFGLDGFHGVSPEGNGVIRTYAPNFNTPGVVKRGEVEMVAAVALKQTRKAGVLRNIRV